MKKLLTLAAGVFLSALLIAPVNAATNGAPAPRKDEGQVQQAEPGGQSVPATSHKAGTSVAERYEQRRAIKQRAADMRQAVIARELEEKEKWENEKLDTEEEEDSQEQEQEDK